jgi:tetratricopeptide (TPR) repeat protein
MMDSLAKFYFNEGLEKAHNNNIVCAVENLSKALIYDKSNIETWNLLGLCYYRMSRFKMAQYCWEQSLSKCENSNNPAILYNEKLSKLLDEVIPIFSKVQSLCSNKKYSKAMIIFEKDILPRLRDCAEMYNYLGVLQQLVGKKQRAIKQWENALRLDSSNEKAKQYIIKSLRKNRYKTFNTMIKLMFRKERETNESIL